MYSSTIMIDPQVISKFYKENTFAGPLENVVRNIEPHESNMQIAEKYIFNMIKKGAKTHSQSNLKQFLTRNLKPHYEGILKSKQYSLLDMIDKEALRLPPEAKRKFDKLMNFTIDKIENRQIVIPFYRGEFKMKLEKNLRQIPENYDLADEILKMCEDFPHYKEPGAQEAQANIFQKIKKEIENNISEGKIRNNTELTELLNKSERRINFDPIAETFSNKNFFYDLNTLLADVSDIPLKLKLTGLAQQLPKSSTNFASRIVKLANKSSGQIGIELLQPSAGTIEHIKPKFFGGENSIYNYGLACSRFNSERSCTPLYEHLVKTPNAANNIQQFIDKLIELSKRKILKKLSIPEDYIERLSYTIRKESGGIFIPNLSKLKGYIRG
ncbi:MAG: hypothetical protein LBK53_03545 [Heliobacteriaceae bacterium]|nr:hypothetical protein [Heliobacteriaceae bacterium]